MNELTKYLSNYQWAITESKLKTLAALPFIDMDDDTDGDENEDGYPVTNGIAVIPIVGTLVKYDDLFTRLFGGTSTLAIQNKLAATLDDPSVQAILFIIDSGGGMVSGTTDLADEIAGSSKPCWAYVSDTCCSGAYWLASQCDQIYANPAATIGSIGVYTMIEDTSKMYEAAGVNVTLIKAGDYKGTGEDGVPVTDAAIAEIQAGVDDIYSLFVDAVAEGRGDRLKDAKKVATGQNVDLPSKAEKMGLIDGIGPLNEIAKKLGDSKMSNKFKVDAGQSDVVADSVTITKAEHEKLLADVANISKLVAEAKEAGIKQAKADESKRLESLIEVAGDRPTFCLEHFKAGHSRSDAVEALTSVLKSELAESKKAQATKVDGAAPVATGALDANAKVDEWDSLTPAEQKKVGSKELFAAYKKALVRFGK